MSLNDFFDKIYCINLDRRPDRWEASQREFDRIGIEVERWIAVDGMEIPNRWKDFHSSLKAGEIGVKFSHGFLLNRALGEKFENILILEDDIEFSPTFNEDWERWNQEIPTDWDMLYLGGNLVGWNPSPVSRHVHKGEGLFAIHALGLSRRIIHDLLVDKFSFDPNVPIDTTYARKSTQYNSYLMVPRMAFQRTDYSDIQNAPANYQFLKQGQFPEVMGR